MALLVLPDPSDYPTEEEQEKSQMGFMQPL